MSGNLAQRIARLLDENHVMTLATSSADGAHAASLFYARDNLSLIWVSESRTRHSRELDHNPRVAATIAPDTSDHGTICGIQAHGMAECIRDETERSRLLAILVARYPFLAHIERGSPKISDALAKANVYRLHPARIVLIDNRLGFGHKEALVLSD
ncbi:pyridoxamine 5'-phosphate oxidase family protein [Bradyrhizobium sp. 14AA]